MRDVVAYELVSADGFADEPDRFFSAWDDVMDANLARVVSTQDAVLARQAEPRRVGWLLAHERRRAVRDLHQVPKHVVTSRPLTGGWSHASALSGDLTTYVHDLKQQPGGDIGVHAGLSVVQALLVAGLLDELRLVVAPAITGHGRRLLDGVPAARLGVVRSETSPTGWLLVDYRVVRQARASTVTPSGRSSRPYGPGSRKDLPLGEVSRSAQWIGRLSSTVVWTRGSPTSAK